MTSEVPSWRAEDGGPRRRQVVGGAGLGLASGGRLSVTTRIAPATTMVVSDERTGASFLLRHTAGEGATATVERLAPQSLEPLASSVPLAAGPVWPGGLAIGEDGDVRVVFGNHAHRLAADDLEVRAVRELPRRRPYNSFVTLPDGHLVTKDFGGSLPGSPVAASEREPCELVVLEPVGLEIVDRCVVAEPSIARLSADGDDVYVVGDTSLLRVRWDATRRCLVEDQAFRARYRIHDGQTYGWDAVLAAGAAWFLDDGDGSEGFSGTLRGHGRSTSPLHLVRVDTATGDVTMVEVCGLPGGLVANPPLVAEDHGVVVAYDSGNGVLVGFDLSTLTVRWRREQDHASHLLLYADTGEVVTGDHADVVVLDVATGTELARADTGLGMQSVLFPAPAGPGSFFVCAFPGVALVTVVH